MLHEIFRRSSRFLSNFVFSVVVNMIRAGPMSNSESKRGSSILGFIHLYISRDIIGSNRWVFNRISNNMRGNEFLVVFAERA